MSFRKTIKLGLGCIAGLLVSFGGASDASADEGPVLGPMPTPEYIEQVNREGRGVGIGVANGFWGSGFAQSLRFDIPFGWTIGQFFGARVHGVIAYGPPAAPSFDPALLGGAELFGRSPVILGLARVYGGGGIFIGGRPADGPGDHFGVAGGGHMGIEVFPTPGYGFSVEVGGQSPVHSADLDAGASIMGGMTWYLGGG